MNEKQNRVSGILSPDKHSLRDTTDLDKSFFGDTAFEHISVIIEERRKLSRAASQHCSDKHE
ncbi:MAG: hypothetical protein SCK57_04975 [Bacillota bacterium]|nr:hypothetical protein [Bacillota bacterium]MDW7676994.1 hypothetical protein [Bacillota bacterium]